jgi:exosortase
VTDEDPMKGRYYEFKRVLSYRVVQKGIVLVLALVVLFWPVLVRLYYDLVNNGNNSHGLLVPFISVYLIWKKRHDLASLPIQTSYSGLVLLVSSLVVFILGYGGGIHVLPRLAFVAAVMGAFLYNYGNDIFLKLAFPLAFLIFMVPVPVSIEGLVSFKLQLWMTQISALILDALSIVVLREGNILIFSNCSLEVAEACSGIRSLMAYIMLGCLFGYMMHGSLIRRSVMVLIALPLTFVINSARVVGTGLLAYYYGPGVARGFLHEFSGIVIFLVGLIMFFFIYRLLEQPAAPVSS